MSADVGALLCHRSQNKGEAAESDSFNIMFYVQKVRILSSFTSS